MDQFIGLDAVVADAMAELGKKKDLESSGQVVIRQVVGLDVSDRWTEVCVMDLLSGRVEQSYRVASTQGGLSKVFGKVAAQRLVLEVGPMSPWMSRALREWGHEVLVVDPSSIWSSKLRKSDRIDAERLARLGRDPSQVSRVCHRSPQSQCHLAILRAREAVVSARTGLICHVRGVVKAWGQRLPKVTSDAFSKKVDAVLPQELRAALGAVLDLIAGMTETIRAYDRQIDRLCNEVYPETQLMRQIRGVGPICSLAFRLTLDDPGRFRKSRTVGAYLGLAPGLRQSGDQDQPLRISKQGDAFVRRLLVNCANYILGVFGEDCDLRRHGERIARGGGSVAKRRAKVAVARKLAVLMHRLWITSEEYDPLYASKKADCLARALDPTPQAS